jgi:hypothetical protein
MKKVSLLVLVLLAATGVAVAQLTYKGGADVLGAHNGYGRGCIMCHAPHSGALGNGVTTTDPENGMYALWGENLTPLYGATISFSGDGNPSKYVVVLPSSLTPTNFHDADTTILFCLSCHDGVVAQGGMMVGHTVETLPIVGGTAPTLLGAAKPSGGTVYSNDHPVGGSALVSCGGAYNWDCTGGGNTNTPIQMTGTASAQFLINYPGSFWNSWSSVSGNTTSYSSYGACITAGSASCTTSNPLATYSNTTVNAVTCTTCHNQHAMTQYTNKKGSFATMFFIKGQYTPNTNGNSAAQFCRNCHGGESNEMNGLTSVPTI